jgi:hypothetical protein
LSGPNDLSNFFNHGFKILKRKRKRKLRIQSPAQAKVEINQRTRLGKSKRIIRIEKSKEIQFLTLCSQIRLDDFKKERSEQQRNERLAKREEKYYLGDEI